MALYYNKCIQSFKGDEYIQVCRSSGSSATIPSWKFLLFSWEIYDETNPRESTTRIHAFVFDKDGETLFDSYPNIANLKKKVKQITLSNWRWRYCRNEYPKKSAMGECLY
jgi:hypothetical protein